MPPTLPELLKTTVEMEGSDLHLSINTPPQVRVHGKLRRLEMPDLTPTETKQLAYSVMTDAQKKRFEETLELDFSFGIRGIARFRSNVFNQRGAVGAVYRLIPEQIKGFKDLGLPPVLATLAERPRGLVLVTGPTGSGKSTTLAAMLDKINSERNEHILTIEDPIEYIHQHKGCLVNQREVHSDTHGFTEALARGASRGSRYRPDRRAARPGDDGSGAADCRDGPLDIRDAPYELVGADDQPHHRHVPGAPAVADQDSAVARARRDRLSGAAAESRRPGRVVAQEILMPTPAIRNLIREDKIHQIYSSMQSGQEKLGTQTFNQSLATLYMTRQITLEAAMGASSLKDELEQMITRGVGVVQGAGLAPRPGMPRPPVGVVKR